MLNRGCLKLCDDVQSSLSTLRTRKTARLPPRRLDGAKMVSEAISEDDHSCLCLVSNLTKEGHLKKLVSYLWNDVIAHEFSEQLSGWCEI